MVFKNYAGVEQRPGSFVQAFINLKVICSILSPGNPRF